MPLLFLDVDGPLIPFGGPAYPSFPVDPGGNPLLSRVDPALGPRLTALGCELVWATTWMQDANDAVAPLLGLPALPVLDWDDGKAPAIIDAAAGRPFVWLDDAITDADRALVAAHHPGPALAHRVDPRRGLTDVDFATVCAWLAHLA